VSLNPHFFIGFLKLLWYFLHTIPFFRPQTLSFKKSSLSLSFSALSSEDAGLISRHFFPIFIYSMRGSLPSEITRFCRPSKLFWLAYWWLNLVGVLTAIAHLLQQVCHCVLPETSGRESADIGIEKKQTIKFPFRHKQLWRLDWGSIHLKYF